MVIGGGPSGAVVARLLASWGHDVRLLTRPVDPARALANSLPPSTRKLLEQIGILQIVDRVGYRTFGNTVWWGARAGTVEPFAPNQETWGYQVDRAALDPLLMDAASAHGVRVEREARVRTVDWHDGTPVVSYDSAGHAQRCRARLAIDCSGRAGAIAVPLRLRQHVAGGRMQALVGVWSRHPSWDLQDPTHTFIETCREGWAWSLPTDDTHRHVGIMVDGATSRLLRRATLEDTYRAQLGLTGRIEQQVDGAALERVFACDASVYTARSHAGDGFLLVGDAGSTLNPLSSFGIKKALASAWLGAVAANTVLRDPGRTRPAQDFFSRWSAETWQLNLARSRDFALEAFATHRSRFWESQATLPVDESSLPIDESAVLRGDDVRAALASVRRSDTIVFSFGGEPTFASMPLVKGHQVVVEDAVALGPHARDVVRYVRGVDLVALARLATTHQQIPVIYERYAAGVGSVSLPDFIGALSLLVARRVLHARTEPVPSRA